MTFENFPETIDQVDFLDWDSYAPYYDDLQNRELTGDGLRQWLEDWSKLAAFVWEVMEITYMRMTLDTKDQKREQDYLDFINEIKPPAAVADQRLKERLLALDPTGEAVADLAITLRNMKNQADLFRDQNVPLKTEIEKLISQYDKVNGGMTADWDGEQKNLSQLRVHLLDKDRAVRERAWRLEMALWQEQRQLLNEMYTDMIGLRQQMAENAGLISFRDYAFREYDRFAYAPADCFTFHQAIEEVVVPIAHNIIEKKKRRLGLDSIRPWDLVVDTSDNPPLHPYSGQDALIKGALNILQSVDHDLARYFAVMAEEELLDLDTRAGKAMGGYCITLPLRKRPFIFMNGVGTHNDVQTLMHEAGHAFHVFETAGLPLVWQINPPMEFAEVASTSMELLSAPYFTADYGGFYTPAEAARARIEYLEQTLLFLPYMTVVDAFQHWVYTHPQEALDPANCDAAWGELWARFMPDVDYSGLEDERVSGWHRKGHIFQDPFYYIEYGMAIVGALQIWRNSRQDQAAAVAAYRRALSLGGTVTLPELFSAAGGEFRFDVEVLAELVGLAEHTIAELESSL